MDEALDLPFLFRYKHMTSLKSHLSSGQRESLPYWYRGNLCGHVCFDLLLERIAFAYSH